MALNFTSDIMALFDSKVGNDANYQAPGNYGLTTTLTGSLGVDHVTVTAPGAYTAIPAVTAATGAATFSPTMKLVGATTVAANGTGYAIGNVLTLSGGTHSTTATASVATALLASVSPAAAGSGYAPSGVLTLVGAATVAATATINTTKLVSVGVNAAGTVYVPLDEITLLGGTPNTQAVVRVDTVKLVSATINNGGTGYDDGLTPSTFTVTVFGGAETILATVSVTTNGSGVVTTTGVIVGGSYTTLPSLVANAVTGDDGVNHGTNLRLNLVFGVRTVTIIDPGDYSTNSTTFTQDSTTSVAGTGATFNTGLFGVLTATPTNQGNYSTIPGNPVATTGGGGTGATLTALWGVRTVTPTVAGSYTVLPSSPISTTGAGTGATLTGSWGVNTVSVTNAGTYETIAPVVNFSLAGGATATAVLSTASSAQDDEKKALMIIELVRSMIDESTNVQQLKDIQNILSRMMAAMKFGSSRFNAGDNADRAIGAAMEYVAKSYRRVNNTI